MQAHESISVPYSMGTIMAFQLHKYWHDLLSPVLRRDNPPTVPQAIVLQDQQVLLVQRDNPRFWELPGGGMAPGESAEQTVIREVREETGVCVEIVELLGRYERTGFRAHCSPVYVCRPCGGQPQPQDDDIMQVQYFPLHTLPHGLCPWYRVILQRDLCSAQPRPLQQSQHLGLGTVLHCIGLDLASRLGLLS